MPLRIIATPVDEHRQPRDDGKQLLDFADPPLAVGAAADCDVRLPGAPEQVCLIDAGPRHGFLVTPAPGAADLRLNDQPVTTPAPLRNGDRLALPGWQLVFAVRFDRARRRRRKSWVQVVSVALVLGALAAQLALLVAMPLYARRADFVRLEMARQRMLGQIDTLRYRAASLPPTEMPPRQVAMRRLVHSELEEMGYYLRAHAEDLGLPEIRRFQEDLAVLGDLLEAPPLPREPLQIDAALETLIGPAPPAPEEEP